MGFTALALSTVLGAYKSAKGAAAPSVQAPPPAPQASVAPSAGSVVQGTTGAGQAGGSPGIAQTFLTGPGGIDPSLLKLGRNTLLGG